MLVKGTDFERLDGYHALGHSFISILVAQGKTWDQSVAFVGHLDQRTNQRYIYFMPKDKRETANSIPFGFVLCVRQWTGLRGKEPANRGSQRGERYDARGSHQDGAGV